MTDLYGSEWIIKGTWCRTIPEHPPGPDEPDPGFPVNAFASLVRISPSLLVSFGAALDNELGFCYRTYQEICTFWRLYVQQNEWASNHEVSKPGWLDYSVIRTYVLSCAFNYYDSDTDRRDYLTLAELGQDFSCYTSYYRTNLQLYSVDNVKFQDTYGYIDFIFVDNIPTRIVTVPITKVTINAERDTHVTPQLQSELTTKEQALALIADKNNDGTLSTDEIAAVDTNQDKVLDCDEVQEELGLDDSDMDAYIDEVQEEVEQLKAEAKPTITIPEDFQGPTTVEEVMRAPTYNPEETFEFNLVYQMVSMLLDDPTVDLMTFCTRILGLLTVNLGHVTFMVISTAASLLWKKLNGLGTVELDGEKYVDDLQVFTAEEFASVNQLIKEREEILVTQRAYLESITHSMESIDTDRLMKNVTSHPAIDRLDRLLSHIERTYVRL